MTGREKKNPRHLTRGNQDYDTCAPLRSCEFVDLDRHIGVAVTKPYFHVGLDRDCVDVARETICVNTSSCRRWKGLHAMISIARISIARCDSCGAEHSIDLVGFRCGGDSSDCSGTVTLRCESCDLGMPRLFLDKNGVIVELDEKGRWCHAADDAFWPCGLNPHPPRNL